MRKTYLLASLVYLFISIGALAIDGDMGAGTQPLTDGSAAYPWLIEDVNDFDAFAGNSAYWAGGVHTQLTTDIDLAGRTYTTKAPIETFSGNFDGQNHTIFNLTVTGLRLCGLFGDIEGTPSKSAIVKNIVLQQCNITSDAAYNGCLIGWARAYSTVQNCHVKQSQITSPHDLIGGLIGVTGSIFSDTPDVMISMCSVEDSNVSGGARVGGLVGATTMTNIKSCYVSCSVQGTSSGIGGIVGDNGSSSSVINCFAICTVTGGDSAGGLCGWNYGVVLNCYADVVIEGDSVGGLIGCNASNNVSNCYSTGEVFGTGNVGGLMGCSNNVSNCYSTCTVDGTGPEIGGLVGENWSNWSNCFWDVDTSGTIDGVGNEDPDPAGVEGKTTAEMQTQSTFIGWDFVGEDVNGTNDIWRMCVDGADYPRLFHQYNTRGDFACPDGTGTDDLLALCQNWLNTEALDPGFNYPCDPTFDGVTNLPDFAVLSQH